MDRPTAYGAAIVSLMLLTLLPYAPPQPLASAWVVLTRSGAEPPESYSHAAWNTETGEFLFAQAYGECHVRGGPGSLGGIGMGWDFDGTGEAGLEKVERQRDAFLLQHCRDGGAYSNVSVSAKMQNFPQFAGSMYDIKRAVHSLPQGGFTEYAVSVIGQGVHIRIASGVGYPEDCTSFFGLEGLAPQRFGAWGSVYLTGVANPETTRGFLLCVHIEFDAQPGQEPPLGNGLIAGSVPRLAA